MNIESKNRNYINSIPLPNWSGIYATIPHLMATDIINECLKEEDIQIIGETFLPSKDGQVVLGKIKVSLDIEDEDECSFLVTFINSYDKTRSFKISAALQLSESGNLVVLGDNSSTLFKRVHKGKAGIDIKEALCTTVRNLRKDFTTIIEQKQKLKDIILDREDILEILADMYFNKEILTLEQLGVVKSELEKPTYSYNSSESSCFFIYMLCTYAVQNRGNQIGKYYDSLWNLNKYFNDKLNALNSGASLWEVMEQQYDRSLEYSEEKY